MDEFPVIYLCWYVEQIEWRNTPIVTHFQEGKNRKISKSTCFSVKAAVVSVSESFFSLNLRAFSPHFEQIKRREQTQTLSHALVNLLQVRSLRKAVQYPLQKEVPHHQLSDRLDRRHAIFILSVTMNWVGIDPSHGRVQPPGKFHKISSWIFFGSRYRMRQVQVLHFWPNIRCELAVELSSALEINQGLIAHRKPWEMAF